jgi:hypothetical protein
MPLRTSREQHATSFSSESPQAGINVGVGYFITVGAAAAFLMRQNREPAEKLLLRHGAAKVGQFKPPNWASLEYRNQLGGK